MAGKKKEGGELERLLTNPKNNGRNEYKHTRENFRI